MARPFIAIIGAIICAYNYDMWDIVFFQISFFSSVVILFIFAASSSDKNEKIIILSTLVFIIIS